MNGTSVDFYSYPKEVMNVLQEKVLSPLIEHHKTILLIAAAALAAFVACYLIIVSLKKYMIGKDINKLEEHDRRIANITDQLVSLRKEQIKRLEKEITQLTHQVDSYSKEIVKGRIEFPCTHISYLPDDELTLPDGVKVKASQYSGKMQHKVELDPSYLLLSEREASNFDFTKHDQRIVLVRGKQYTRLSLVEENPKNKTKIYHFETEWKEGETLPEIRVTLLVFPEEAKKEVIMRINADIDRKRKKVDELKKIVASLSS